MIGSILGTVLLVLVAIFAAGAVVLNMERDIYD